MGLRSCIRDLSVTAVSGLNESAFNFIANRYENSSVIRSAHSRRAFLKQERSNPIEPYLRPKDFDINVAIRDAAEESGSLVYQGVRYLIERVPRAAQFFADALPDSVYGSALETRADDLVADTLDRLEDEFSRRIREVDKIAYQDFLVSEQRLVRRVEDAERETGYVRLGLQKRQNDLDRQRNYGVPFMLNLLESNKRTKGIAALYFDSRNNLVHATPTFLSALDMSERDLLLSGIPYLTKKIGVGEMSGTDRVGFEIAGEKHSMDLSVIRYAPEGRLVGNLVVVDNIDSRFGRIFRSTKGIEGKVGMLSQILSGMGKIPDLEKI